MTGFASFLGLCLLITITPGLDTAVVIRSALRGGRAAGLRTALGCAAGLFVHATAVAFGLAELLLRSDAAFEAVKLAGALVLVLLGGRSLWSAWRSPGAAVPDPAGEPSAAPRGGNPFMEGLLTNLTNPKATLFFVAALPQFVPADRAAQAVPIALGLAAVAVLFQFAGLGLTAWAVHRLRHLLRSRRVRRAQDTLLGAVLIGLGVRVATE
ncbi:LysE family efflux protein [Streptomyces himastatinicus ATCC 53653]|uniref:LysE family efflux protein n=1 Tax=Streptomyces himastatinicus ATCC 53653 TaxID=457427 RepID=D9WDR2_9ACTN|nr:LysE family translocator [Streptomyces himastatinicus]EFL27269.1 LysE family efflux protein [Streptomyces himastatinicus ATCC 53653]